MWKITGIFKSIVKWFYMDTVGNHRRPNIISIKWTKVRHDRILYIFRGFVKKTYIIILGTANWQNFRGFVKVNKSNVLGTGIIYKIPRICKHHQRISYTADYEHMDNKDRNFVNDMIGHKTPQQVSYCLLRQISK